MQLLKKERNSWGSSLLYFLIFNLVSISDIGHIDSLRIIDQNQPGPQIHITFPRLLHQSYIDRFILSSCPVSSWSQYTLVSIHSGLSHDLVSDTVVLTERLPVFRNILKTQGGLHNSVRTYPLIYDFHKQSRVCQNQRYAHVCCSLVLY